MGALNPKRLVDPVSLITRGANPVLEAVSGRSRPQRWPLLSALEGLGAAEHRVAESVF